MLSSWDSGSAARKTCGTGYPQFPDDGAAIRHSRVATPGAALAAGILNVVMVISAAVISSMSHQFELSDLAGQPQPARQGAQVNIEDKPRRGQLLGSPHGLDPHHICVARPVPWRGRLAVDQQAADFGQRGPQ